MVVVEKKNGSLRICLDPRDLNKAIKRQPYPTTTLDDITNVLKDAKIFSTFDTKNGYWQVRLTEESSKLTTFNTPVGRYRWLRLPFGICTASEVFQMRIKDALEGLNNILVIADDILVFGKGKTIEEATIDHDKSVIELFNRLRLKNIKLNKDKIQYKKNAVNYMGHIISKDGLKIDDAKVKSILQI